MFLYTRNVHLYETDLGQVVHHSNYWRYLEESRHQSFHSLGFLAGQSSEQKTGEEFENWVIYDVQMKYVKPLKYCDQVAIISRAYSDRVKIRFEYLMYQTTLGEIKKNRFVQDIFSGEFKITPQVDLKLLEKNMNLVNKARTDIVLVNRELRAQRIPDLYRQKFGETKWTETWL